jgi:hypothetical protein
VTSLESVEAGLLQYQSLPEITSQLHLVDVADSFFLNTVATSFLLMLVKEIHQFF